jgi:hypothetical protein
MKSGSLNNVVPPVALYASAGNPYKSSLSTIQNNIKSQNALNNKHGGSKPNRKSRKGIKERKRGGSPASVTSTPRPTQIVIPQAPTGGMSAQGPTTGNSMSSAGAETLIKHFVNSQYDSKVVVPPVPQSGGSLIKRLQRLTRKVRKGGKKRGGKTRRNYRKKK